jgi:nickel-dependent lactate racemase
MIDIKLTKHIFGNLNIDPLNLIGIYEPQHIKGEGLTDKEIFNKINNTIGTKPLSEIARGCKNVLIVTDDNTRQTPLFRILPFILTELESSGIKKGNITILIGLGTHRGMTKNEMLDKFGDSIAKKYCIANHEWDNPDHLFSLGHCELGFEVIINRLTKYSDLIISVGSIVPHATAGFSGGGKTIMPGICAEKTIEDTHWAALNYNMNDILGSSDNKVRQAIVSICRKVGLKIIVNTVLFNKDQIYDIVVGDVDIAHRKGGRYCDS